MDCRFYLKGKFRIYGRDYPFDMSLNWHADSGEIDRRITEFFLRSYEEAYAMYDAEMANRYADQARAETERREREELKRLQEKYPSP